MTAYKQISNPNRMAAGFMICAFIGLFGETALNMALTNIMSEYNISTGIAQWLTTGYLLVLGILVPISAYLIQRFTTRQLAMTALLLSILGTLIGALAFNFPMLLFGRIFQAIGTGIFIPLLMNVMLLIYPIERRGSVMGIMGLVITLAPAIGPTLSGLIVDVLNWHYIFWLSLCLYIVLLIIWLPLIQNVTEQTSPKLDIPSVLLSTVGFGFLIYSLGSLTEKPFSSPIVYMTFSIGLLAIVAFGVLQVKRQIPMIDLSVFRYRFFVLGTSILVIDAALILAASILLPLYLKGALFVSAITAGLILLPGNILNAILAPIVGRLFDRIGPTLLTLLGMISAVISMVVFLIVLTSDASVYTIAIAFAFLCVGLALSFMPAQTNGLNQLPPILYAHGSAVMNTLQQLASAAGTALAIVLMNKGIANSSTASIADGVHYAFYYLAGIAVIGLVLSLFIRKAVAAKQIIK